MKFLKPCKGSLWSPTWKRKPQTRMTKAKRKFTTAWLVWDTFSMSSPRTQVSWFVMFRRKLLTICWLSAAIFSAGSLHAQHADGYQIVHAYPHDPDAFTQGLIYVDGHLYESTGRNGRSSIRMVELSTGKVLQH